MKKLKMLLFMLLLQLLLAGAAFGGVGGDTVWVAVYGNDANNGVDNPVRTIDRALEVAGDGDIICLQEGLYPAPGGDIAQGVTISGAPGTETVNVVVYVTEDMGNAFNVKLVDAVGSTAVTIANLTIDGDNPDTPGTEVTGYGVYSYDDDTITSLTVENCSMDNLVVGVDARYSDTLNLAVAGSEITARYGVRGERLPAMDIEDNTLFIVDNNPSNCLIYAYETNVQLNDNTLYSDFKGKGTGIYADYINGVISGNSIKNLGEGMEIDYLGSFSILDNYMEVTTEGLDLSFEYDGTTDISGNVIINKGQFVAGYNGMDLYLEEGANQTLNIKGNQIKHYFKGIYVDNYDNAQLQSITLGGSAAEANYFRGNIFNLELEDVKGSVVDATYNDWGSDELGIIKNKILINGVNEAEDYSTYISLNGYFASAPQAVWVNPDYASGSSAGHSFGVDAFDNVTDAVTNVARGGTVHVAAGEYDEALLIYKPVTVSGAGEDTIFNPNLGDDPIAKVAVADVTLEGLSFLGSAYGVYVTDLAAAIGSTYLSQFEDYVGNNLSVKDCYFREQIRYAIITASSMISTDGLSGVNIDGNTIIISTKDNYSRSGIFTNTPIFNSSIINNQIEVSGTYAIYARTLADLTVANNHVVMTRGYSPGDLPFYGIIVSGFGDAAVDGNIIDTNGQTAYGGLAVYGSPPSETREPLSMTLYNNEIHNYSRAVGFAYGSVPAEEGTMNVVVGNNAELYNDLSGNEYGLESTMNKDVVDATNNYWGVPDENLGGYILDENDDAVYGKVYLLPTVTFESKLSNLQVSAGSLVPGFTEDILEYDVSVGYEVEELMVTPTADRGTITVNGDMVPSGQQSSPIALQTGESQITVEVSIDGGEPRQYLLTVTREEQGQELNPSPTPDSSGRRQALPAVTEREVNGARGAVVTKSFSASEAAKGITIDSGALEALVGKERSLRVDTPEVSVFIAAEEAAKLFGETEQPKLIISVSANQEEQGFDSSLIAAGQEWDVSINMKSSGGREDKYSGPVTLLFNYDDSRVQNPLRLGIYRFEDNQWRYVGGYVNSEKKTISATVGHRSIYRVFEDARSFNDLEGHWAKEDIEVLAARYIVNGMPDGSFAPARSMTRGEIATLIANVMAYSSLGQEPEQTAGFSDISPEDWYYQAINTAGSAGLIAGYPDGTFRPAAEVTRQEMVVLAIRLLELLQGEAAADNTGVETLDQFTDAEEIDTWAADSFRKAVSRGIVRGTPDKKLNPAAQLSRAEGTALMKRVLEMAGFI